jgi:hypothetical protein
MATEEEEDRQVAIEAGEDPATAEEVSTPTCVEGTEDLVEEDREV